MDMQASPQPAELDEQVDEVGSRREQFGEFVDYKHKRRQWRSGKVRIGPPRRLIVVHLGHLARTQQFLTSDELTFKSFPHAVDEKLLVGQVRDRRDDVVQPIHAGKRRASFEVDENEVELFRAVGGDQPEYQRSEELRLARAGRADAQSMGPVPALRRFLEVEVHGRTRAVDPHSRS